MKNLLFGLTIASLLPVLLAGCNKPESLRSESVYTFINETGNRITLDVYDNKADYGANMNRLQQYTFEPTAKRELILTAGRAYWIDWYGENYSQSNWQNIRTSYNRGHPTPELNIAAVDENISIRGGFPDTTRSVLINGAGLSSTWIGTVTNYPPINGTHKFIFRKDFSVDYTHTDENGAVTQSVYEFMVASGTTILGKQHGFIISVMNSQFSSIFRITCNPGAFLNPHTGRDNMLVRFQQLSGSPEFSVVRQ